MFYENHKMIYLKIDYSNDALQKEVNHKYVEKSVC